MALGWSAVIVAAGKGTRMGAGVSKQYLPLGGKPILVHTLEVFERMAEAEEIVLVVAQADIPQARSLVERYGIGKVSAIVAGGSDRQGSVREGLKAVRAGAEWVMVHDAVRPFVRAGNIRRLQAAMEESEAAVLAVPVKDTVKLVSGGFIQSTPDRSALWAVQTPQAFRLDLLRRAHAMAEADGIAATDDAMLVERLGVAVRVVEGDYRNIKITTPEDLLWAEALMQGGEADVQDRPGI
jgi:2-C-methyl-D-erythritol 4-phosphate cytidylyltransferase